MKKTLFLTALLAAASITGFAYNLYAPNSFDPVSPKSWDYRTVKPSAGKESPFLYLRFLQPRQYHPL